MEGLNEVDRMMVIHRLKLVEECSQRAQDTLTNSKGSIVTDLLVIAEYTQIQDHMIEIQKFYRNILDKVEKGAKHDVSAR